MDQERDESECGPSSLNEVAVSMVWDEILSNGGLVTDNWPSIISLVLKNELPK